jgi:CHAT domain-containing protein
MIAFRIVKRVIDVRVIRRVVIRWIIAAASVTIVVPAVARSVHDSSPVARLIHAAEAAHRRVEARVCGGFRWTQLRPANSSSASPDDLDLQGTAGEIFRESERTHTVAAAHAAAIASLLLGQAADAIRRLEPLAHNSANDASVWSDLAAARYTAAVETEEPHRFPAALAAADRALRLAPRLAEAHFNRALILTRLGLRNEAGDALRTTISLERDPAWASEARRRRIALSSDAKPFPARLNAALKEFANGKSAALDLVTRRNPQDARLFVEARLLTGWAEACARSDAAEAAAALRKADEIARSLASANGDRLLLDSVHHIQATHGGQRKKLVAAWLAYRDGRQHYAQGLPNSDRELGRAAVLFGRVRSPMQYAAQYYNANAMFDRNRTDESRIVLERLLKRIDRRRYASLAAGAEKQLGMYYAFRGMWTASLLHVERGRAIFERLGERMNAAFAQAIVGEVCDRIGQFDKGWRHRSVSLDVLSTVPPNQRSVPVLIGAVHAEIMRGDLESALSLLHITRDEARQVRSPSLTAEAMVREARVLLLARGAAESRKAVSDARTFAADITDSRTRNRIDSDIDVVEGQILRSYDPRKAVDVLTRAIAFYETNGFGMLLPQAYLERGRAWNARGDRARALTDFEKGLLEIERQRTNVAPDIRTTIFDTVPELISETVDLLLVSNRPAAAYAVVQRARARTLIEALGARTRPASSSPEAIEAALPKDGVLIEYTLLPKGVAAFCIGRRGMRVVRLHVTRSSLRNQVSELAGGIEERRAIASVQGAGAKLYSSLIQPLEHQICDAQSLFIVPDRFLYATPFAALFDQRTKKYLVQKYAIIIAPAGSFITRRLHLRRTTRPALVISDPANAAEQRLPAARREASAIARLYGTAPPLVGRDATLERFVAAAPRSALVHYAGHAQSDEIAGGFLPLAPGAGNDGRMDATAISRLSLKRTNLVILSACATMRGNLAHVEGMPSISRAFLQAGVPAVVGMLWRIDDAIAARLLLLFHRRLSNHATPSESLRAAQCALIASRDQQLRHPASWAAAELLGVD